MRRHLHALLRLLIGPPYKFRSLSILNSKVTLQPHRFEMRCASICGVLNKYILRRSACNPRPAFLFRRLLLRFRRFFGGLFRLFHLDGIVRDEGDRLLHGEVFHQALLAVREHGPD